MVTLCTYLCTHKDTDGEEENTEFMKKLAYLRTHAQVFLSMLNDMRRRLKELPPDAPTAQQYRYVGISYESHVAIHPNFFSNVMRDVTRLLYLLNKKPSAIEIPPDGVQLLTWSEQILQRYLASQVIATYKCQVRCESHPTTLRAQYPQCMH